MRRLAGYADRISARPGDRVGFKVSCDPGVAGYRAELVRLWCLDDHRDGPGVQEEVVPAAFAGDYPGRTQPVRIGSAMEVRHAGLAGHAAFRLVLHIWPTLRGDAPQVIAATDLWQLRLTGGVLQWAGGAGQIALTAPLPLRRWTEIELRSDGTEICLQAGGQVARAAVAPAGLAAEGLLVLADAPGGGFGFNGKLARPRLWSGSTPLATWNFAADMGSVTVPDRGPQGMHGRLVNMPLRAVRGPGWDGSAQDWRARPDHYDAIHFHADDLSDCNWQDDFAWTVPEGLPSGLYAARLVTGGSDRTEYIPLWLRPAAPQARAVFLASTATYMAYANYRVMNRSHLYEMYLGQVPELVPDDLYLNLHPELGDSLYTTHADGSGMAISSRHRPILNMRPNAALSAFADDGWILAFLRAQGIACDVLTDEDLDREGAAALEGYDLVLTGNHPEYVSTRMWDGVVAHLGRGGRLIYLGGNGFYWRVAFHAEVPGVIELRRAEDGSRPWDAEPGEYYHAFNGEYGGMWRRVGRPPQALLGVGFSASGFDISRPYDRLPAADDPRAAFLFAGVPETVIGDAGIAGGGAAGQEIDRYDPVLGSPPHALIVARATGHTEEMMITKEDMPAANYMIGAPDNPLCRADMVFFETPSGGAVFSTGSIAWAASLPVDGFAGPTARITANAIRRFVDPTPFAFPEGEGPG
jgi:N,N-dimethylformamidase